MSDQLYLSYRIRGFTGQSMLTHYGKLLREFPFSRLEETSAVLRIHAIAYSEPVLLERAFPNPLEVDAVLSACREFESADCTCRLEASWDLWQFDVDWKISPSRIALCCFGPDFADEAEDQLRVEFGLDSQFLPQDDSGKTLYMVRSNIRSLLHFVHQADDKLAVESRRLWSESGENFADRLQRALEGDADSEPQ
jgi:hypothetical protein